MLKEFEATLGTVTGNHETIQLCQAVLEEHEKHLQDLQVAFDSSTLTLSHRVLSDELNGSMVA